VYTVKLTGFPLTWKVERILLTVTENMMCITRVVWLLFVAVTVFQSTSLIAGYSNVNKHSVHVETKWCWKGVGVGTD